MEVDRDVIASLHWEQRTRQEGVEQGIQQGVRLTLENLFTSHFGRVDSQLEAVIEYFAKLISEDYAQQFPSLLSLSRDELVARFGASGGDNGNVTQA